MAWKDLTIAQRSQLMNLMRHNGITDLSEMRRIYDAAYPSIVNSNYGIGAPIYDDGGEKKNKGSFNDWLTKQKVNFYYNTVFKPAIKKYGLDEVRLKLYDNIDPFGYDNADMRVTAALATPSLSNLGRQDFYVRKSENAPFRDDIWRTYLGVDPKYMHGFVGGTIHTVEPSKYSPTIGSEGNIYYRISDAGLRVGDKPSQIVNTALFGEKDIPYSNDNINPLRIGEVRQSDVLGRYFGDHSLSRGIDPQRGEYISYYDLWDIAPMSDRGATDQSHGIGTPINFYDRIYLDDYFGVSSKPQNSDEYYGGYITPAVAYPDYAKGGHKIHIKKENRGKFTALKERTGHSATWFKENGTPAQKKMAIFELNSKKWKHEHGGIKF